MSWTSRLENSLWNCQLLVEGPISVGETISFRSRKDAEHLTPLMSNISIKNAPNGALLRVNSYAFEQKYAIEAALIFSGYALDILSTKTRCPLTVRFLEERPSRRSPELTISRTISQEEWMFAFRESRLLMFTQPTFLRALGWFRKGLVSIDPMDKFLAYWNSIEVIAGKYHTRNERTSNGIKNQIWQCFLDLWGENDHWKIISGDENWIDYNYNTRKDVAHGLINVDVASMESIAAKISVIEDLAHEFIIDWRNQKLNPEAQIDNYISSKLEEENWIRIE